ncbi:MAG: hypothetical protein ACLRSY_03070 [Acutalibacter sp.]
MPQVQGMFAGDRARKEMLVNYGFRLPSALTTGPELRRVLLHINQAVFVSATPGDLELESPPGWRRHPAHRLLDQNHRGLPTANRRLDSEINCGRSRSGCWSPP